MDEAEKHWLNRPVGPRGMLVFGLLLVLGTRSPELWDAFVAPESFRVESEHLAQLDEQVRDLLQEQLNLSSQNQEHAVEKWRLHKEANGVDIAAQLADLEEQIAELDKQRSVMNQKVETLDQQRQEELLNLRTSAVRRARIIGVLLTGVLLVTVGSIYLSWRKGTDE